MKKRNLMATAFAVTAILLATGSCKVKSERYYSTYMTAVATTNSDNQSIISHLVSDDSIKILPGSNLANVVGSLKGDQRILAIFTIPSGKITDPVQVEFSSIQTIPRDSILQTSEPDTLANDPMTVMAAWHSGGIYGAGRFITLTYLYKGTTYGNHFMYLTDDTSATGLSVADVSSVRYMKWLPYVVPLYR